jgi:hypothetical protein
LPSGDDELRPVLWMVLCSPTDNSAPWLRDGLQSRGFVGVETVTIDSLIYSTSITQRLTDCGTSTRILIHDGRVIDDRLQGTVNRVDFLPMRHLSRIAVPDQDYAMQELFAIFTSILYGLPGAMLNRACDRGLCGPVISAEEWLNTAADAGLHVDPIQHPPNDPAGRHDDNQLVYLVDGQIVSASPTGLPPMSGHRPVPPPVAASLQTLAGRLDVNVLTARFHVSSDRWTFLSASGVADLRQGGEPILDAIALALR